MKNIPTLLRLAEHRALSGVELSGTVLDLGGDTHAVYRSELKGPFTVTTVNMDPKTAPDMVHDLETPLRVPDASYDNVLLINVLEHIYHAQQLLEEAVRVTRPGGIIVVVVPFLFPIHPDPSDFWRFSGETLKKMLAELGVHDCHVEPLGSGVFAARYVMLERLMPYPVRFVWFYTIRFFVGPLDALFIGLASMLGKRYRTSDYALGYAVTATKST